MLNELPDWGKKRIPIDFWPLWALIKAVILPFQGIRQQAEHLLYEYKINDNTLQKAQLKQHKIFQNFPTNPTHTTPSAPPLPTGATPKASPLLESNGSNNDSPETLFDIKTGNTF